MQKYICVFCCFAAFPGEVRRHRAGRCGWRLSFKGAGTSTRHPPPTPAPRFFLRPSPFFSFRLSRSPFLSVSLCPSVCSCLGFSVRVFFSLPACASPALALAVETTHGAPAVAVPLAYSGLPGPGWGNGSPSWPRRARPGLPRSGSGSPPFPPGPGRREMASVWAVGPPGLERGPWRVRPPVVCLSKSLCACVRGSECEHKSWWV